MIVSASFTIHGEGLETRGLVYRLTSNQYPVVGPYGVLTFGFVYNVNEDWSPITLIIGTGWTQSFTPVPSTGWTASFQPVPSTSWTLSF